MNQQAFLISRFNRLNTLSREQILYHFAQIHNALMPDKQINDDQAEEFFLHPIQEAKDLQSMPLIFRLADCIESERRAEFSEKQLDRLEVVLRKLHTKYRNQSN